MVPAATKTAICQNRWLALLTLVLFKPKMRWPLTRKFPESRSSNPMFQYSFVVAEAKNVHQRKPSKLSVFAPSVTKKPHIPLNAGASPPSSAFLCAN